MCMFVGSDGPKWEAEEKEFSYFAKYDEVHGVAVAPDVSLPTLNDSYFTYEKLRGKLGKNPEMEGIATLLYRDFE